MKAKILIVDDDLDIRESLVDLLSGTYQIEEAHDGKEAVEFLTKQPFDLAILDIMMPKLDGYQVATKIKDHGIEIPFIFLTAKAQSESKNYGLKIGADDYITKPFSGEELLLRVQKKLLTYEKIKLRNKRIKLMHHNIITPTGVVQGVSEILKGLLSQTKKKFQSTQVGDHSYIISKADLEDMESQFKNNINLMNESTEQLIKTAKNLSQLFYDADIRLNISRISLRKMIYDIIVRVKPEKVQCHISDLPELYLEVDVSKVSEVFYELFDNSLLHNDNRTVIVNIKAELTQDHVVISFEDNGRGIAPEDQENAFKEFWTGYSENHHTRGHGIGLWISKKYIEAHAGELLIKESVMNKGTTLSLSLSLKTSLFQ